MILEFVVMEERLYRAENASNLAGQEGVVRVFMGPCDEHWGTGVCGLSLVSHYSSRLLARKFLSLL